MTNYAQQIADRIKSLTVIDRASLKALDPVNPPVIQIQIRREICLACAEYNAGQCSTGCYIEVLINSAMLVCPLNKWSKA